MVIAVADISQLDVSVIKSASSHGSLGLSISISIGDTSCAARTFTPRRVIAWHIEPVTDDRERVTRKEYFGRECNVL